MIWPFRARRYVATAADMEQLRAGSVAYLETMPGTDVVIGTLFTDPLAPPEEDPDEFYLSTPEAAPERLAEEIDPLPRAALLRLRVALLSCLDPAAHGRLYMAVEGVSRWGELEALLDRELPVTGGSLVVIRRDPDTFSIVWRGPGGQADHVDVVRGVHF